jgi:uncharacterized tellurite resistance protein B-like protein
MTNSFPARLATEDESTEGIAMLGSLRTLISRLDQGSDSQMQSESEARLATAALLIRLATVDSDLSEDRRSRLHRILKSGFALDDPATGRLIEEAVAAERRAIDLYQFTRRINDALDDGKRRRVVQMMWEMAYVDGRLNGFEANVIWRTADLLGVPSRQRIEIRQQVAAGELLSAPV